MYPILIIALVIFLDQLSKYLVLSRVMLNGDITIINKFFYITYVQNYGIAFGMFKNNVLFFTITTSIISVAVAYFLFRAYKKRYSFISICLSMIMGGAIGNLIDRIRLGYVVDFLHFSIFPPVFNIADSAIVIGAIALCGYILIKKDVSL
ncbi:MAG: signal peptidase II [Bacillota bacterium]